MEREPLLGGPSRSAWRVPVALAAVVCLFLAASRDGAPPAAPAAGGGTALALAARKRAERRALALDGRLACASMDAPGWVGDAACAASGGVEPWACDDSCGAGTWCGELCGDRCGGGGGGAAPCIYATLADLSATCASLEARRAPARPPPPPGAAAAPGGEKKALRWTGRDALEETCGTSLVASSAGPASPSSGGCDAETWCDHCAPSEDCAALLPAPLVGVDGDHVKCAVDLLNLVPFLCDRDGLLA